MRRGLPRVRRSRRGDFELRLPEHDREVLGTLPGQLRELLASADPLEDPVMRRLYPAAYLDDPEAAKEFDGFVRDELTAGRLAALDTMERTAAATRLSEEELLAWLAAINDVRLVLGVRLHVTEESEPEDFAGDGEREESFELYSYLSYLEEEVVEALSGT
jgi:hypothetical protein